MTMKKLFVIALLTVLTISVNAQEKKSKIYEQHRSSKTRRYVTKSETKKSPSTTYTTKRNRSKNKWYLIFTTNFMINEKKKILWANEDKTFKN